MTKPLKKPLKKAAARKPTPIPSAWERGALPSKGKCKHTGPCFRVDLFQKKEGDLNEPYAFHWLDEAGAVMFSMRESRNRGLRARVYGPDRELICSFEPRTYDVKAAHHALLDYNEWQQLHHDVWTDVAKARGELDPTLYPGAAISKSLRKPPVKKALAKKKLKKR